MDKHILPATIRDLKIKTRRLRTQGLLPANVYGADGSRALSLDAKTTDKLMAEISESTVIYLDIDGQQIPTLLSEVQYDPIDAHLIHIAFRQVDLTQKVTTAVPVETTGTFAVPGATYNVVYDEIEAEGLPTDFPEAFILDLGTLKAVGDEITFADLDYDRSKLTLQIKDESLPVLVVDAVVETPEEQPAEATTDATPAAEEEKKQEPAK